MVILFCSRNHFMRGVRNTNDPSGPGRINDHYYGVRASIQPLTEWEVKIGQKNIFASVAFKVLQLLSKYLSLSISINSINFISVDSAENIRRTYIHLKHISVYQQKNFYEIEILLNNTYQDISADWKVWLNSDHFSGCWTELP